MSQWRSPFCSLPPSAGRKFVIGYTSATRMLNGWWIGQDKDGWSEGEGKGRKKRGRFAAPFFYKFLRQNFNLLVERRARPFFGIILEISRR